MTLATEVPARKSLPREGADLMFAKTKISITVATFGRPSQCRTCLVSLEQAARRAGAFFDFELILGLNGRDPKTAQMLSATGPQIASLNPKIFYFDVAASPAALRNRLLPSADGDWIYFIDDDAHVDEDIFLKFAQARLEFPSAAALGGPNLNPPDSNDFQTATGHVLSSRFATFFSSARYRAKGKNRNCGEESLILCNLFIRRASLERAPFPEEFVCCEESWLLQNMQYRGETLTYVPHLSAWHERRHHLSRLAQQVVRYGYGRGQILKRRPEGIRAAHLLPSACVTYTLAVLAYFCFHSHPSVAFLSPFIAYIFLCLAATLGLALENKGSWKVRLWTTILFPVIHVCYGIGLVLGFIRG